MAVMVVVTLHKKLDMKESLSVGRFLRVPLRPTKQTRSPT